VYCMKCGEKIPDNSKFCGRCAHKVPVDATAPAAVKPAKAAPQAPIEKPLEAEPVKTPAPEKAPKQAKLKRKAARKIPVWGWIAIGAGVVVVALILIFTLGNSATELHLSGSCQQTFYVQADEMLELHYGHWGVLGDENIEENEAALTIWLYVNDIPSRGRLATNARTRELTCADRQDFSDAEWNDTRWMHAVSTVTLGPGTHHIRVVVSLTDEISDGFDNDGDGFPDMYGPGEVFTREYTIVARE